MKNKVYASFDEAVADVPDGATFMSGGFASIGVPRNLISALVRQGAKELTGISNNSGGQGEVVDVGKLVENGQIRKMVCAFTAAPHPSRAAMFEKLHEQGLVEAELVPQGTLVERMRAAGAGIGAFYTPDGRGHGDRGRQGATRHQRSHLRARIPAPGRLRLRARLPRRHLWQPAVPALAAQLQSDHGYGRENHHRRSRGGHPGARRDGPRLRFTRRASWWTGWSRFPRRRRASGTRRTGGRRGNQQSPRGRPPSCGLRTGPSSGGSGRTDGVGLRGRETPFEGSGRTDGVRLRGNQQSPRGRTPFDRLRANGSGGSGRTDGVGLRGNQQSPRGRPPSTGSERPFDRLRANGRVRGSGRTDGVGLRGNQQSPRGRPPSTGSGRTESGGSGRTEEGFPSARGRQ